jgi:hypothetical protein
MAKNDSKSRKRLDEIYDLFDKKGVQLDRDSIWEVQGTPVVYHKDVERLGAAIGVEWEAPQVIRAEADEAVILVVGRIGERMEWSFGEAKVVPMVDSGKKNKWGKPVMVPLDDAIGNYQVSPKQGAYVYAMAEKRGKDRVILKLADLHGDVYSDQEADDLQKRNADDDDRQPANRNEAGESRKSDQPSQDVGENPQTDDVLDSDESICANLRRLIDESESIKDVTELMLHKTTQEELRSLPGPMAEAMKAYAKKRLAELGWPGSKDKAQKQEPKGDEDQGAAA